MDVYITCMVAMDKLKSRSGNECGSTRRDSNDESKVAAFSEDIVRDIQLPVLLNLALCALKLGMLRKAESFCNFALQTELGKSSSKAYFRRGRARMLMGSYVAARNDLEMALELLTSSDSGTTDSEGVEKKAVRKELQKLVRLEIQAKKHEVRQKKAMKRVWSSSRDTKDGIGGVDSEMNQEKRRVSESAAITESDASSDYIDEKKALNGQSRSQNTGLYSDRREQRPFSSLRANTKKEKSDEDDVLHDEQSYVQWYLSLFERCLRKTLRVLGDEEGANMGMGHHDKDE
jgi:tetratricopeptide (TPR) repeat protein